MALVEGTFKLNDNAKVKFKFSERLDKILVKTIVIIDSFIWNDKCGLVRI